MTPTSAAQADDTTPDWSVVIINMNARDFLLDCIRSLQSQSGRPAEIILVDNASIDGSVEAAEAICPGLISLPQSRNLGYVPANNVGLEVATGRYVMFLNNDAALEPGCLEELTRFLESRPEVGAISGQILNPDGSDQGCARSFPSVANGLFGRRSALTRWFPNNPWSKKFMVGRHREDDEPFEVEILSSACIAFRREVAVELGGMDEDFDLYWVDAEMCGRVRRRGLSVYCVPRARIVHHEGSGGSTATFRQRLRRTIGFHRDAYLAYRKVHQLHAFDPRRWFAATALTGRASILALLQLLRPGRATSSGGQN